MAKRTLGFMGLVLLVCGGCVAQASDGPTEGAEAKKAGGPETAKIAETEKAAESVKTEESATTREGQGAEKTTAPANCAETCDDRYQCASLPAGSYAQCNCYNEVIECIDVLCGEHNPTHRCFITPV
jgi:hypothetical protein